MRKLEHRLFEGFDAYDCKSVSSGDDFASLFEQAVYSKAKDLQYKAKAERKAEKFKDSVLFEFRENLKDEKYIHDHFTLYDEHIEFEDVMLCFESEKLEILKDALKPKFKIFIISHMGMICYRRSDFNKFSISKKVWLYFYNYIIKNFTWLVN